MSESSVPMNKPEEAIAGFGVQEHSCYVVGQLEEKNEYAVYTGLTECGGVHQ